jgi:dihydrolipoamide dehydrogenase
MPDYDVVVIGGGPGGYEAAIRAAQLGLRVGLVEREFLGGVCLNIGCIPSKTLLRNAEIAELLRQGQEFGFSFENLKLDYETAYKRSRQVSDQLTRGVQFLMRKNKIDVFQGVAQLRSSTQVDVTSVAEAPAVDGQQFDGTLDAKNIIIATGARVRGIPGVEMDGERVLTYREAIHLRQVPQSIAIIGAGPVGMELGYVFRAYGSQVTLIEMMPNVLPLEDAEISAEVAKAFTKQGSTLLTNARVESVARTADGVEVKAGGQTVRAEKALVAIGFIPNSENIGLEKVGVRVERGAIVTDGHMRTNVPNIYAIGDVTAKMMLAHVASAQGVVAAETIAGAETVELDYGAIPRCTYCHPQVASMGLTQDQACEQGYEVRISRFPFQANGKALGLGNSAGFVKLVSDAKYGEILGVHMVGPEVTELLPEYVLARNQELTLHEIVRSVHAHPTLSEALAEAAANPTTPGCR